MEKLEDIIQALQRLSPEELTKFEAWYDEFAAALFDAKLARDSLNGKFDALAEQAIADFKAGRCREI
jgi:hypothetical protein